MKYLSSTLLLFFSVLAFGQSYISPGSIQKKGILLLGGTIHVGNGTVINKGVLAFENGKITAVGEADLLDELDETAYDIVNVADQHVYPGFIASNTQLGLKEIGAVRATRDNQETGKFNPNVRALIAYNTDSRVIPTVRSNGVLLAQITPTGGRVSGLSSVVQLDAWNWEDAALRADDGIHLNWPNLYSFTGWRANPGEIKPNEKYDEEVKELTRTFQEAVAYAAQTNPSPKNLKLEAMKPLMTGQRNLYIHVNNVKGITESILFTKKLGITPVIVGGRDAWMVADFLKEQDVPVLLRQPHSLPRFADADIDQPFKTPAQLQDAGVLFGILMNQDGFYEIRNLGFQAGHSVPYGLAYEDALQAISLNVAKILGIDKQTGSLEKGKDATLFISAGDALDIRTCKLTKAYIQGRIINLDNKHEALYRKYKSKYETGE